MGKKKKLNTKRTFYIIEKIIGSCLLLSILLYFIIKLLIPRFMSSQLKTLFGYILLSLIDLLSIEIAIKGLIFGRVYLPRIGFVYSNLQQGKFASIVIFCLAFSTLITIRLFI